MKRNNQEIIWRTNLINRTVDKISRMYDKKKRFITHLCLAFLDRDTIEVKVSDIDPNIQQFTCALTNKEFDEKVPAYKTIYTTVLLSEIAIEALAKWYATYGIDIEELRESMNSRKDSMHIIQESKPIGPRISDMIPEQTLAKIKNSIK